MGILPGTWGSSVLPRKRGKLKRACLHRGYRRHPIAIVPGHSILMDFLTENTGAANLQNLIGKGRVIWTGTR